MFGDQLSAGAIPHPVMIAGVLPAPLHSSRPHGWNGVIVERYCLEGVEVTVQSAAVLVTVHLGPTDTVVHTGRKQVERRGIAKGDITVTPPGQAKGWRHPGQAEFVAVWLAPALIERIAAEAADLHPQQVEILENLGTPDWQVERIGLSLLCELEHQEIGASVYVESLANELAVHLLRRYSTAAPAAMPSASTLPGHKLRRVLEYLNENFSRNLTLSEIARTVGMSPYHFAHVFKQTTGLSPHKYLVARRVACAESLLRETDLPITEIAHRVGYANQSHFSTLFHRAATMTPKTFRQQR
jgi:AraC family transcriptional regulator